MTYDEFKYDPQDISMKEEYLMDQESYYNPLDFTDKKFGCTICDHSCGSKSGMSCEESKIFFLHLQISPINLDDMYVFWKKIIILKI